MNRRTIPEIRERLYELAGELGCAELRDLADETKRRPPVKRAPCAARGITPALARRVRAYVAAHPRKPNREIGAHFGIDGGRVSEILAGKRGEA